MRVLVLVGGRRKDLGPPFLLISNDQDFKSGAGEKGCVP